MTIDPPLLAHPPLLESGMALPDAAKRVLREMVSHFTTNLHSLRTSDDPETAHQARVGWRRLRSGIQLFRHSPIAQSAVPLHALKPLLSALGNLRDLDVARTQTLPPLMHGYVGNSPKHHRDWRALQGALDQAAAHQRQRVRSALDDPNVEATLAALSQWAGGRTVPTQADPDHPLCAWAKHRIQGLRGRLKKALRRSGTTQSLHRVRIISKHLRYSLEVLDSVLPRKRARQWHKKAVRLQSVLGHRRDQNQALRIAKELPVNTRLIRYLKANI